MRNGQGRRGFYCSLVFWTYDDKGLYRQWNMLLSSKREWEQFLKTVSQRLVVICGSLPYGEADFDFAWLTNKDF